jgi:hypothetical protein
MIRNTKKASKRARNREKYINPTKNWRTNSRRKSMFQSMGEKINSPCRTLLSEENYMISKDHFGMSHALNQQPLPILTKANLKKVLL